MAAARDGAGSHDGLVAGTPGYMSPEQARGEGVDARSDIWAFGCVVYEMLTARPAFVQRRPSPTRWTAMLDRGPDWERLPPAVPPGIRRMLRRCLERDPGRRLHHIADARLEIEDAANDAEPPGSGARDEGEPAPRPRVRRLDRRARAGAGRGAGRVAAAPALGRAGTAGGRDHHATNLRSGLLCPVARWAASRVRRRSRRAADAVGTRARLRGRAGLAGHRTGAPALLVARQPLDRVLQGQRTETHRCPRRLGADRHLSPGRDDGRVGTGRHHPVLQHRLTVAPPRQCGGRARGGGDRASGGFDRPSPSPVPARRPASSCSSSAGPTPCAASTWARSGRRR